MNGLRNAPTTAVTTLVLTAAMVCLPLMLWLLGTATAAVALAGSVAALVAGVVGLRHATKRRVEADTITAGLLDAVVEGVIVLDRERRTIQINQLALDMFGVELQQALGHLPSYGSATFIDRHGRTIPREDLPSSKALRGIEVDEEVIGIVTGDGRRTWTSTATRLLPGAGQPTDPFLVITVSDITSRFEADLASEAETVQLRHRALHDSLTGLPNRTLLMDRLAHAKQNAGRRGVGTGLIVVDLDGFKEVNDNLGHAAGDEVLVQVAVRLRTTLRASDTAARLGGDEFVVLCEDLHPGMADLELRRIADRLQQLLDEPYVTSAGPANVGASLGYAVASPGEDLDLDLVVEADEAMLADKRRRKAQAGGRDAAPVLSPGLAGERLAVYIVDDDPAMRLLASRILESSGTRLDVVGEAADGTTAIEEIIRLTPDLVLCDVMMPVVSGPEVVSAVREKLAEQRFIFWSATTAPELERYEQELGVPFVLKDRIEELPAALLDAAPRAGSPSSHG